MSCIYIYIYIYVFVLGVQCHGRTFDVVSVVVIVVFFVSVVVPSSLCSVMSGHGRFSYGGDCAWDCGCVSLRWFSFSLDSAG
jgi:hypothetical protein